MTPRFALQVLFAVLAGSACGLWLGPQALASASSNLVSALSILNAAIFPTVVLSATVLKPGNLSLEMVERYRLALKRQISFFFGVLLFSLMTIGAIIIGQTMDWKFPVILPWQGWERSLDGLYNFLIIFSLSFVAMRLPAFLRALVSLVNVHVDGVAIEVTRRDRQEQDRLRQELAEMPNISGHQLVPRPLPVG